MSNEANGPQVCIILGSPNDADKMRPAAETLDRFGVSYVFTVASAHRSPDRAASLARSAQQHGIKVIIAAAGMAAHLGGVLAAHTPLPVIGVPLSGSALNGWDALLSTAQMPPGVPVATMAVDGAVNAAVFATQILATADSALAEKLVEHKQEMTRKVEARAQDFEKQT